MSGVRLVGAMVAVLALMTACTPSAGSEGPLDVGFGVGVQPEPGETPEAALARVDELLGPVGLVRVYYPGLPDPWPGKAPGRDVVVSFKLDPAQVVAGTYDGPMRDWFGTVPAGVEVFWSYWHEPEDDIEGGDFTAEQFTAAFEHLDALADEAGRAAGARLRSTLVLMSWSTDPDSGRDWRDYVPAADAVDVMAWDVYNRAGPRGDYADPATLVRRPAEASAELAKPFAVAEFGSVVVAGDSGAGRAEWLTGMGASLDAADAVFAVYFDFLWNGGADDYRLRDPASIAAWRSLEARSSQPPAVTPSA